MDTSNESTFSLDKLNDEALTMIIDYLSFPDKVRVERVSKRWKALALKSSSQEKKLDVRIEFQKRNMQISDIKQILWRCGESLTHINLAYLMHLKPKEIFGLLNKYCKNLVYIDISTLKLAEKDLNALSTSIIKNLKTVHMNSMGCDLKDTPMLISFFKKAEKLETFGCTSNYSFDGKALLHLSQTVKSLDLSSCSNFRDMDGIKAAFDRLPNLEELDISDTHLWSYSIYDVAPRLKSFTMSMMIQFFDTDNYTDLSFAKLEHLDASNQCLNEEFIKFIGKKCPKLKKLNLHSTGFASPNPDAYKPIKNLKNLEHLIISSSEVNDKVITFWMSKKGTLKFKRLECECSGITQKGLIKVIETLPELEFIYFGRKSKLDMTKFLQAVLKSVESRTNSVPLELQFLHKKKINDEVEELKSKRKANSGIKIEHFVDGEIEDEDGDDEEEEEEEEDEDENPKLFQQRVKMTPVAKNPAKA